jgi:hypothetical protein
MAMLKLGESIVVYAQARLIPLRFMRRACVVGRDVIYRKECQEKTLSRDKWEPFVTLTLGHSLASGSADMKHDRGGDCNFSLLGCVSMHLSELSQPKAAAPLAQRGYGKFEYTREGVNHARGNYPRIAGCAITSLNAPSDSEIVQPVLGLAPNKFVGVVACTALEHAEADARNVAGDCMACMGKR